MEIAFIGIGLVVGLIIGWLIAKQKISGSTVQKSVFEKLQTDFNEASAKLLAETDKNTDLNNELTKTRESIQNKEKELRAFTGQLAKLEAELATAKANETQAKQDFKKATETLEVTKQQKTDADTRLAKLNVEKDGLTKDVEKLNDQLSKTQEQLELKTTDFNETNKTVASLEANNKALEEKLTQQKKEIKEIGEKFNKDFELIANKILEEKTDKFTSVNKANMEDILKPLGENLESFKKKVDEVYDKEAKERFSLGEKVKELAELNQVISNEARNLTNALKSESKTQGRWGEMILESILEKSGLRKDEEYFMEHQLVDEKGKPLRSDSEDKKMRPDAVIKYPDNRSVIIDSKVSLNAFTRYIEAGDEEQQKIELDAHIAAIKHHIVALSTKGYDDYDKALDFVMMFIPSEPAYIAAMQGDPNLWNFAYDKRILLMNPTNLITSLKLIVDLWKREYQNQNAIEIASRGAKLYDKFVGFVNNMEGIGANLIKAQGKYDEAYKQLSTGNDNLVLQATKLKNLGLKTKKELSQELVHTSLNNQLEE